MGGGGVMTTDRGFDVGTATDDAAVPNSTPKTATAMNALFMAAFMEVQQGAVNSKGRFFLESIRNGVATGARRSRPVIAFQRAAGVVTSTAHEWQNLSPI